MGFLASPRLGQRERRRSRPPLLARPEEDDGATALLRERSSPLKLEERSLRPLGIGVGRDSRRGVAGAENVERSRRPLPEEGDGVRGRVRGAGRLGVNGGDPLVRSPRKLGGRVKRERST